MSFSDFQKVIEDSRVSGVHLSSCDYESLEREGEILAAIKENASNLGWASENRGAFGNEIADGASVVIKPNFVLHKNRGTGGMLPLITHQSFIKTVVDEVLKANPASVLVGDAPIQSCDFGYLLGITGLDDWSRNLQACDPRFKGIADFRRTISRLENGALVSQENSKPEENYVLFNLREESLLEPITDEKHSFRVTCYDPRLMAETHSRGNHQFLVAREIIEADVVINLPKLKTHKKAGITNALKNLVGINGNKEYLPHHRIGSAEEGGDCYPTKNIVKKSWEFIADQQNMAKSSAVAKLYGTAGVQFERIMRLQGDKIGVEGAWQGNETVAKMSLDLNRILLYGKSDGTFGDSVQRNVLHVCDAVIAGQGDGPLASDELPLGMILMGRNAPAMDWIGAALLGYDPEKIPLTRESFEDFRWALTRFSPSEIHRLGTLAHDRCEDRINRNVVHPNGWVEAKKK